jgi:hypothetical protein
MVMIMDSIKQGALKSEAPERARAVTELIESTLGIKIGPVEITEAAMSLSNEEKIKLAATIWEAAMPPMTEPTAGVYVLSAKELAHITESLDHWYVDRAADEDLAEVAALLAKLHAGDTF